MARHSGKNLKVTVNGNAIDGCRGFNYEETVDIVDLTAAGDAAKDHDGTQVGWNGSIDMLLDNAAGANQTLRAGDVITVAGYTEGDAVGMTYMSGSATVTTNNGATSHNGETTRNYGLEGKGALSFVVVA